MLAIFKKELRSYFLNAIGYVYLGVFLAVSALLCCYTTLGSGTYDTSNYFSFISIIFSNTLGLLLLGAAFIAVGMFISSLTENQLAAAIITVAIIGTMLLLNLVNSYVDNYVIRFIISWVCFMSRYAPFQSGIFDPSSLLYFVSVAGVFLFLTARVYDKRRWG